MSKLSSLPKAERAAVIDETDRLFAERTGVKRRLDPAHDKVLVQKWLSICDEVIAKRGGGTATKTSTGSKNATGGVSAVVSGAVAAAIGGIGSIPTIAGAGLQTAYDLGSATVTDVPAWVKVARGQIGVKETSGKGITPQIIEYILTCDQNFEASGTKWADRNDWEAWVRKKQAAGVNIPMTKPSNLLKYFLDGEGRGANDEGFEWCAAFVNWCLRKAGINGANHAAVSQWRNWGGRLTEPRVGAIMLIPRGKSNYGHIAFVDREDGKWKMLGGNQAAPSGGPSNQVSRREYPSNVTALLWPHGVPKV